MSDKLKIAYIVATAKVSGGGGLRVVLQHANNLISLGHDVELINVGLGNSLSWYKGNRAKLINYQKNSKQLENTDYDIVVATYWETVKYLKKLQSERKIYFIQSDERRFYHDLKKIKMVERTYQSNYEFMTMACWIQSWLKREFNRDSFYVPNALNEEFFRNIKPLREKNDRRRILLEGGINIPYKGMDAAYELVKNLGHEIWIVSNDGKPRYGWHYDKFFQNVSAHKMAEIYRSCDLLVKLSKVESFGLPVLEMMACGGACIVKRVTGIEDFVVDGSNALVVDNEVEAKEAIRKLTSDKNLLDSIGENGILTAEKWNLQNQKKYLADMLEKVMVDNGSSCSVEYEYKHNSIGDLYSPEAIKYEYEALLRQNKSLNLKLASIENSRLWKLRNLMVKLLHLKRKI